MKINPLTGYRIEDRGHTTPCWIWKYSTNDMGYGLLYHKGWRGYSHRWLYEHHKGPIPADKSDLDHLCRVRACCNPDHLEPVTHAENMRRGLNARLKAADVIEIRTRFPTMPGTVAERNQQIASEYGISKHYVRSLIKRRKWADLAA